MQKSGENKASEESDHSFRTTFCLNSPTILSDEVYNDLCDILSDEVFDNLSVDLSDDFSDDLSGDLSGDLFDGPSDGL